MPPLRADLRVIAARYALRAPVGEGAFSQVWRAEDRLAGGHVAVKLARVTPAMEGPARRERAALRHARLPGVVPLLDDGQEGEEAFLVMPLVEGGQPFPGVEGPVPWSRLAEPAARLLEILARVHRQGLVHRDLKPSNVLVTPDGRVHLLDFGVASGRALRWGEHPAFAGTPSYAAPEARRFEPLDARADLWSVGAMLYEALTGETPHAGVSPLKLLGFSAPLPIRALHERVEGVPAAVAEVIHALLAEAPGDRPPDAESALERLGRPAPVTSRLVGRLPERSTEEGLRELFHGPDAFLHLREDAARCLFARTDGERGRVGAELDGWVRSGLCHVDGEAVRIGREAIASLQGRNEEAIALARRVDEVGAEACLYEVLDVLGRFEDLGEVEEAELLATRALLVARDREEADAEATLVMALGRLLLCSGLGGGAFDGLLRLIESSPWQSPSSVSLERLVRAERAAQRREWARAEELVALAGPQLDADLELSRRSVGLRRRFFEDLDACEAQIEALRPLTRAVPDLEGRRLTWLGNVRYRQSRFREAAELHERAAALRRSPNARLVVRINAVAALIETEDVDRALVLAGEVAAEAAALRRAGSEVMTTFLRRAAAYRLGLGPEPDDALVDAAQAARPRFAAALATVDACSAWRANSPDLPRRAGRAVTLCREVGAAEELVLSEALGIVAGLAFDPAAVLERAQAVRVPAVSVQAQALLALAGRLPREVAEEALSRMVGMPERGRRREVLSLDECSRFLSSAAVAIPLAVGS